VVAVLTVAAVVAIPVGGWQHVDRADAAAEHLEPGERHVADQFATTLDRAAVTRVAPGSSLDPEPGVSYLVVYGRMDNRTDRTQSPRTDMFVLDSDQADLADLDRVDAVKLVADPGSFVYLQPGLPADVAIVWEIEKGLLDPGDELRIGIVDRTSAESQVGGGTVWLDPRIGAVVDLVVGSS